MLYKKNQNGTKYPLELEIHLISMEGFQPTLLKLQLQTRIA